VTILEKQSQIDSDTRLGNKRSPPGVPPLIGDGVMHDTAIRCYFLKAVLVDECGERAFDNLINQEMGRLHRPPAASPAHGNDPPIPAMQLDQAPYLGRSIGFQTDQSQGWRHDFGKIGRITVKSEHGFRAGGKCRAGVESGGHG